MQSQGYEHHELDRELYGEPFAMFLDYMSFAHYGNYEGNRYDELREKGWFNKDDDFENDVFSITPYCWCDLMGCERCRKPNFHYKPTDFKLYWYKYPLRGNNCNRDITAEEFLKIINQCTESFFQ